MEQLRSTHEAYGLPIRGGVDAYIDWVGAHPGDLPYEFRKLSYKPEKWSPEDVVRIRTTGLSRNIKSETARSKVACHASLAVDAVRLQLQPAWKTSIPANLDPCLPDDVLKVYELAASTPDLAKFKPGQPVAALASKDDLSAAEGSNNWVIAPAKSATGHAVLADDPHRAYTVPSLRYFVHLNSPGLDIIGAGEPSAPGVAIGHNSQSAFGLTIFNIDQEDLYVYRLNPADPSRYWYMGRWERIVTHREAVAVRGQAPVSVDLQFTRHGPVIYTDTKNGRIYAVKSVWSEPGSAPYMGSLRYLSASSFSEFQTAMADWRAPSVNQVYADVKGNIGWVAAGLTPKRDTWDGLMPVPGDGTFEWNGFWKGSDLPHALNPASGYYTTSNDMNLPAGYPVAERKIGFEWANDARHSRISNVLASLPKVTIEDSQRLQNDEVSLPAQRLVALLKPLHSDDPTTSAALKLLKPWDGVLSVESSAAALEELWFSKYLGNAYKALTLSPSDAQTFKAPDTAVLLSALEHPGQAFGSQPGLARDNLLLSSLHAAYNELLRIQGPDPALWQWGRLHTSMVRHPMSAIAGADAKMLDVGPFPRGGSPYTPNQSSYDDGFKQTIGPSARLIIDLGNWDNSRAVNYPGQSGSPTSSHYRDLVSLWTKGEYFPLLYSRAAIEANTESIVELMPAK